MPENLSTVDRHLAAIREQFVALERQGSLAEASRDFTPLSEAGGRIREERRRQNLTLQDVAELAGLGYTTVHKIEKGAPGVRMENLMRMTEALGLKLWIG